MCITGMYHVNIHVGCYHSISVSFCSCETEAETLMRVHLFPATPKQSQLAFSFELLDWLEALMLECQVSTKDFVAAIDVLTVVQLMKVSLTPAFCVKIITCFFTLDKEMQLIPSYY